MAKTSHLRIDDKEVRETFQQLSTFESKAALREFKQYMRVQTDQMWDVLSNAGGSGVYRGESWPGFAPQYTRKTDGVTVPAWGGVPKVLGQGQVQGRLRPSGRRLTSASAIMQDTGNLRGKATASTFREKRGLLEFGTTPSVSYAAHQAKMRPYLFFVPSKDLKALKDIARRHLAKRIK